MKETAPAAILSPRQNFTIGLDWLGTILGSPFFLFFFISLTIKGIFLFLDPSPQVFLGDSASYLQTALTGWIPPDRSFLYGFLIRFFTGHSGSLFSLVLAQALASACTAALAGWILWRFTQTPKSLCGSATILCSLDPIQLMYERFVMAEAFSLLTAVIFVLLLFLFINDGRYIHLVAASISGLAAVALRISFLPIVIALSFSAPVIRYYLTRSRSADTRKDRAYSLVAALGVVLVCHVSLHTGYKLLNGWLSGNPPAYQYADGFSLLAAWYPAMNSSDLEAAKVPVNIVEGLAPATLDRRRSQRWSADGIVTALLHQYPDTLIANQCAKTVALHTVRRDPIGVADLALSTYFRAWEHKVIAACIKEDTGKGRAIPKELLASTSYHYHVALDPNGDQATLTKTYFAKSADWYRLLLLSPFLLLISTIWSPAEERWFLIVLFLYSGILLLTAFGLSVDNSIRYLHPLGWPMVILIAYWLGRPARPR